VRLSLSVMYLCSCVVVIVIGEMLACVCDAASVNSCLLQFSNWLKFTDIFVPTEVVFIEFAVEMFRVLILAVAVLVGD